MDKLLLNTPPPNCVRNEQEMIFLSWMFKQSQQISSPQNLKLIKRAFDKKDKMQLKRNRPQWLTSYNEEERVLLVWIYGTVNAWDWANILNARHKSVNLLLPSQLSQTIAVHEGMYNAVNDATFYPLLFADISMQFLQSPKKIDRIIFGGHSQGGAIASMMYVLWKGNVECDFVKYFKEHIDATRISFDMDSVYTLGAVHFVAHDSMHLVDELFGKRITNVINGSDPIPMMYAGNRQPPKEVLTKSNKFGLTKLGINSYAQRMMDTFHTIASFGPIGNWLVMIGNDLRALERNGDYQWLYEQHLVFGADTYRKTKKKWTDLPTLLKLQKHHLQQAYIVEFDRVVAKYVQHNKYEYKLERSRSFSLSFRII